MVGLSWFARQWPEMAAGGRFLFGCATSVPPIESEPPVGFAARGKLTGRMPVLLFAVAAG
jgi:hypothetical protein